jgi:phage terminase large subunit-like protein
MNDTFVAPEQVRQFGEQATESTKALGRQFVDAYEQAVNRVVEAEKAAAATAPADWAKTAIAAHASFVADVNAAYLGAVRSVLN